MKPVDRIKAAIRRICFTPSLRDSRSRSDLYFMELTLLQATPDFPTMGVSARRAPAKGLRLIYNPEFVDGLSDTDLHTILCHEAQHLRRGDLAEAKQWLDTRDWYNGWEGAQLVNYAADCQINDYLEELGYPHMEGAQYGIPLLGHTTHNMGFEAVMREIAAKLPPQQSMDDLQAAEGDEPGQPGEPNESEQNAENGEKLDMHKEAEAGKKSKGFTKGGRSKAFEANAQDVARWGNFLAEIMDTKKQEDTWQRIPRRLAGVDEYLDRQYVRPATKPLPRKHALVAIDVSGSMDERLVNRMLSAVRNSPANYDLTVVTFNHELHVWADFRSNPVIPNQGGGTDIEPVIDHVSKLHHFPERILVLTDGEFHMPQNVPNPQRWIFSIYGDSAKEFETEHKLKAVQMERLLP